MVTAGANTGYQFTGFSGSLTGGSPGYVIMNSNKSVTANFTPISTFYTLTTGLSPSGAGSVNPLCPSGCSYSSGSQVTMTATPASGYQFSGWTGTVNSSSNPLTVTMSGAMTEAATFTPIATQYQLTTSVNPAGAGSISPATGLYSAGPMTIMATANSGYAFSSFTGTYSGTTNPLNINLNGNGSITANFVPGYVISGQVTLAGGGTGVSGVGISASGSQSASTTTDASGRYWLPSLAAGGSYTVAAFKSGYLLSSAQSFANLSGNQTATFTATPSLSINGGSNTAEVAPGTNVSMAFNLFSSNGANDVSWAQFYFADSAGNTSCMGDWGRPNGLYLYDGDTGATWGFGINQSDSFCTVSLSSITNSPTDPTLVTVILNFNFAPGTDGTYTVMTQINYGSGYAGPWEALGTLTIDPAQQPVTSPPVHEPPPTSEPMPTPPAPVSQATNNCDDISGTWNSSTGNNFSLSQNGSAVSGTETSPDPYCGTVVWQISGYSTGGGAFTLTESSPQPAVDACGHVVTSDSANVQINSCSSASISGGGGSTTSQTQFAWRSALAAAAQTTWTRASSPPGITLTVDLMAGTLTTQLTGQRKTSDLTIAVKNSQGQQILLTPHGSAQAGARFSDRFRTLLQAGQQYGSVTATWDTTSVTVPVNFFTIGYTHFTQYNTPYHSGCSGSAQQAAIVYKMDAQYCYYRSAMLIQQFVNAVNLNGTGVYDANGTNTVLKAYAAGARNVCDAYSGLPQTQTFFSVDAGGNPITTITGTHNRVLSDGTGSGAALNNSNPPPGSLATDPTATNTGSQVYRWSDAILLFGQNDNNDVMGLRSVQDLCPACSGQATEQSPSNLAHIDMYNGTSQSCSARAVGDYGNYYAIRLR